jgi:hypothetical protein
MNVLGGVNVPNETAMTVHVTPAGSAAATANVAVRTDRTDVLLGASATKPRSGNVRLVRKLRL